MTLWQKISDTISDEIRAGTFGKGERLPASSKLADRYGVHQHTVLKALSHLETEGVLRVEHGRGTFVADRPVRFRLDAWFEQNVAGSDYEPSRHVVSVSRQAASEEAAARLRIGVGDPVVVVVLVGYADGTPIYIGRSFLSEARMEGVGELFEELERSGAQNVVVTELFARYGVRHLHRREIVIYCRAPEPIEVQRLKMSRSASILETALTLVDDDERPIIYSLAGYCSDRVLLALNP